MAGNFDRLFGASPRGNFDSLFGPPEEESSFAATDKRLGSAGGLYEDSARVEALRDRAGPGASPLEQLSDRIEARHRARPAERLAERQSEYTRNLAAGGAGFAAQAERNQVDSTDTGADDDPFFTSMKKAVQNLDDQIIGRGGGGLIESLPETMRAMRNVMLPGSGLVGPSVPFEETLRQVGGGIRERAGKEIERNTPDLSGSPGTQFAYDLVGAFSSLATAVGVTAATKSPTAGIATLGAQVFGDRFGQSIEEGRTREQAFMDGAAYGLAEVVGENKVLGAIMKPGGKLSTKIAAGAVGESLQEGLTSIIQNGYDVGILNEDMTLGEFARAVTYDMVLGAAAGGGAAAVAHPFTRRAPEEVRFDSARERPDGLIEAASVTPVTLTPEDVASPLPNERIAQGRQRIEAAAGTKTASQILQTNAAPEVGKRVEVIIGGEAKQGVVEDAFSREDGEGIKVKLDDGSTFDEYFDNIRDANVAIVPLERAERAFVAPEAVPEQPEPGQLPKGLSRDAAIRFVMRKLEGGGQRVVDSGGVTRYGISKNANPDVDVENLTEAQAADLYKRRYWDKLGLDDSTPPDFALVAFDAAINHGVGAAQRMVAEAKGDTGKLLALRRAAYADLIRQNGAKYGKYERGWENRLQTLEGALGGSLSTGETETVEGAAPTEPDTKWIEDILSEDGELSGISGQLPAAPVQEPDRLREKMGESVPSEPPIPPEDQPLFEAGKSDAASGRRRIFHADKAAKAAYERGYNFVESRTLPAVPETAPRPVKGDGTRTSPVEARTAEDIARAGERVNTEPTEAQREAMNYAAGHVRVQGIDIAIENPKGSTRTGSDASGREWRVKMPASYGRIKRSEGQDGEQVDVYVGDQPTASTVFVIDQVDADTKTADEHKVMLGFESEEAARATYEKAFSDGRGPERIGAVTPMSVEQLKEWLKSDTTVPAATDVVAPSATEAVAEPAVVEGPLNTSAAVSRGKAAGVTQSNRPVAPNFITPASAVRFVKALGGIADTEGHALSSKGREIAKGKRLGGRGLNRYPGLLNRKGMSVDQAGEALWEAGYFGPSETQPRPSTADVLELLEENRYRPDEVEQVARARAEKEGGAERKRKAAEAREKLNAALKDEALKPFLPSIIAESDKRGIVELMMDESDATTRDDPYSAAPEYFLRRQAETLNDGADETGNSEYEVPFYGDSRDAGSEEASRDDGAKAAEAGGRSESVAEDAGGGKEARPDSREDGDVGSRGGVAREGAAGPAGTNTTSTQQEDAFGERPEDKRKALERRAEGRKKATATQKPPGSEGGLFDDNSGRQLDIESDALAQARAALQTAMTALDQATVGSLADTLTDPRPLEAMYRKGDFLTLNGEVGEVQSANERSVVINFPSGQRIVPRNQAGLEVAPPEMWPEPERPKFSRADPVDTPEFRAWFGGSAVVDENGNPLVVYHGTGATFEAFESSRGVELAGVFFSSDRTGAYDWGLRRASKPKVISAYVSLQNPADQQTVEEIKEEYRDENGEDPSLEALTEALQEAGYDGFMDQSSFEGALEIVAFEPSQIKSTDNIGTFDSADDRFRFRRENGVIAPVDAETAAKWRDKLQAEMKRLGIDDRILLEVVGKSEFGDKVAGTYWRRTITVALDIARDPMRVFNHEAVHALKGLGLFRESEWTALSKAVLGTGMADVKKRYPDLNETEQVEEAIAELYGYWRSGRESAKGFVAKAFQRISDLVKAIQAAFRGETTSGQVFRDIESGKIGRRESGEAVEQGPLFSIPNSPAIDFGRGKFGDRLDAWRTAMQDRMLPILRAQAAAERVAGRPLAEEEQPYLAEELMTGRVGAQLEKLEARYNGLFEALDEEKITADELESYLYARHAPERNASMAAINPQIPHGSGMSDIEAAAIIKRVEDSGKLDGMKRLAKHVDDILTLAVETRVEAGLMTREQADEWRGRWKHYVPLKGFAELPDADDRPNVGSGISVRGPESKRAFGRRSQADDIIAHSIMQAEEAVFRAGKNKVGQALYNLAEAVPDPDFWATNKVTTKKRVNSETGLVENYAVHQLTGADAPYTVSLKIDGKERRVTFNARNPDARKAADAMRRLNEPQISSVVAMLSKVNRFLSSVNTSLNPEFVITNAFRDLQTAAVNLAGLDVKGLEAATLKDWRKGLFAATKGAFGKEGGEWGRWWREFVDEGGRTFYNDMQTLDRLKGDVERRMDPTRRPNPTGLNLKPKQLALIAKEDLKAVLGFIDAVNTGIENAVRLSVYKNARELGVSKARAASLAKNLTVNFNRRGAHGVVMNSLFLFYNASIQGSTRILLAMKHRRVRHIVAGIVVAGAMQELLNMALSPEDDDGELIYDKLDEFEKQGNIIFMAKGPWGDYIKLPMPWGYRAFHSAGRNLVALARGKPVGATSWNIARGFIESFNPVGGTNSVLNFLAPTLVDPAVDLTQNRDFAGRPIMPDQSQFEPEKPMNQRYWANVGPQWKMVTDFLNSASGGDEVVPGTVDVSPEALEYLFGVATGAAGAFVDRSFGLGTKIGGVMAGDPNVEITVNDIPLVRKVVGSKPAWYDKAAFYARLDHVDTVIGQAKDYIGDVKGEVRDPEGLERFIGREQDVLAVERAAKAARKALRKSKKERGQLEARHEMGQVDDATLAAGIKTLDDYDKRIRTDFNSAYLEFVETPKGPSD